MSKIERMGQRRGKKEGTKRKKRWGREEEKVDGERER